MARELVLTGALIYDFTRSVPSPTAWCKIGIIITSKLTRGRGIVKDDRIVW